MRKFRVMLVALAATVVIAAGQVGVAQAVLLQFCTGGGDEAGSPATLAGTYTFSFFGANVTNVSPLAGEWLGHAQRERQSDRRDHQVKPAGRSTRPYGRVLHNQVRR